MDDVAISLATISATQMVPLIQHVVVAVHQAFRTRGLTMNLEPGKTEVVVMFRGPGTTQCRTQLFDRDSQPRITVATDTHIIGLRVASSYRHLGVRFAMNLDIGESWSSEPGR